MTRARPSSPGHDRIRADGGRQTWHEWGEPSGRPVLYCHGFPATGYEAGFADTAARRAGIRIIAPDRPGFGGSSPIESTSVARWSGEIGALLDSLAIERLPVLAVSGGAPYALALAARSPGRVVGVATIGGLGPLHEMGTSAGMSALGRISAMLAARQPPIQGWLFRLLAIVIRAWPTAMLRLLSTSGRRRERELLQDPATRAVWIRALRGSVANGAGPAIAEMRRYVRPWGFDWGEITAPVTFWHGTMDSVVPPDHARYLAQRMPHGRLELLEGEGHFSAAVRHIDAVLARLAPPD